MSPEKAWQRIAETAPYWGVTSRDEFKGTQLDPETRARFFSSGEEHVAQVFAVLQRFRPGLRPTSALDFGCGVGRVTIPLARRCERVTAIDVSEGMLAEAARNVAAEGLSGKVQFGHSFEGTFDLVHSHHVFQHIPQSAGLVLTRKIVTSLATGGAGVLHFHHYRDASAARKAVHWARSRLPLVNGLVNLAQGRPWSEPLIIMEAYSLNRVLRVCGEAGVVTFYAETLEYRGSHSVLLYLFK